MASFTYAVDHFQHIESVEMAFHDEVQLMLGWMIEFDVKGCHESIEDRARNNDQVC